MIVDASAILAILLREPEAAAFEEAIAHAGQPCAISGIGYWEVMARLEHAGLTRTAGLAAALLDQAGVAIAEIDGLQIRLADRARSEFGKGRHPAQLNMGDCFAYALAKARNLPLLFKGGDFSRTDIEAAL